MFTQNSQIQLWLAERAAVEPRLGGKYELFWDAGDSERNSTTGCRITAIAETKLLAFEWKGPVQFAKFMNDAKPLTHVTVVFIPNDIDTTEIHLIHTGWGRGEDWEEARSWFERVWDVALGHLAKIATSVTSC